MGSEAYRFSTNKFSLVSLGATVEHAISSLVQVMRYAQRLFPEVGVALVYGGRSAAWNYAGIQAMAYDAAVSAIAAGVKNQFSVVSSAAYLPGFITTDSIGHVEADARVIIAKYSKLWCLWAIEATQPDRARL
jgi:hypothetical protein